MKIVLMGKMAAWTRPELEKRLSRGHDFTVIADPRQVDDIAANINRLERGEPLLHVLK